VTIFERRAADYDAWYDTPTGAAVFAEEVDALRPLMDGLPCPWLEVGTGSGRFASALGVATGLDPATPALRLARRRGIRAVAGAGESLPVRSRSLGAVLLVVTLCFVRDPAAVITEARRVLVPNGGAVFGVVPAESPWGRHYRSLAAAGHPYYRLARFYTVAEVMAALGAADLVVSRVRSSLLWPPEASPPSSPRVREGWDPEAGFAAVLAVPGTTPRPSFSKRLFTHRR